MYIVEEMCLDRREKGEGLIFFQITLSSDPKVSMILMLYFVGMKKRDNKKMREGKGREKCDFSLFD